MEGIVKFFNESKGWGFIVSVEGDQFFAHYSEIKKKGFKTLLQDQKVSFDEGENEKGKVAQNIVVQE